MSRLIDADTVKRAFIGNRYGTKAIEYVIDNVPTVEAIPVEWLLKRAKLCTADYANCLYYSVEAWRTEQKCMVNGRWKFPKDWEEENEELV